MFERYTEKARRVIFFARYEASQLGGATIETEHLLLGVLREDKPLMQRFLREPDAFESIRQQIANQAKDPKLETSVDLPLSHPSKRVLAYAAEECERMNHKHITPAHLLLGLLRESKSLAADLLAERGLDLTKVRDEVRGTPPGSSAASGQRSGALAKFLLSGAHPGVTVLAKPGVGPHSPTFAVYAEQAAPATPPSTPAEEIAHLRRQIKQSVGQMENAIANHEFAAARACSDEERQLRRRIQEILAQHPSAGDEFSPDPTPCLCIEVTRAESFSDLQSHIDDYLAAGVSAVWVLNLPQKRAYTATAAEGFREFRGDILRLEHPLFELNLKQLFAEE